MKNFKNRAIAFLLAFAMVATTMFSDVSMISADDTVVTSTEEAVASNEDTAPAAAATDEAAPSNEEAAPTETTDVAAPAETTGEATQAETTEEAAQAATTEEAAPAETTQTETTDEAAPVTTTEATAPVTTTETTPAATETPAVTETPAAAPAETPAAATYTQAVSGSSSYNGVTVTVNAPVGAFQDGTTLAITPIESSSVNNTVAGAMGENFSGAVAFDITFSYNGVEVQPAAGYNVDVNFTVTPASSIVDSSAETQDIKVFHLESEGSAAQQINAVTDVPVDATALVDSAANSFSIYVVAASGIPYTTTYEFYNDTNIIDADTQIVKNGDTLNRPASPEAAGKDFNGWYTADGVEFTGFGAVSSISATTTVKLYAHFGVGNYIYFMSGSGDDAEVLYTERVENGNNVDLTAHSAPVDTDHAFIGWNTSKNSSTALSTLSMGTTNITLYPVIKAAHWITYHTNGGTAVNPVYVLSGDPTVKPADPIRAGYTFGGWYSDEGLTTGYTFGTPLSSSIDLYAKWNADSTTIKVIYWQETLTPGQYNYVETSQVSVTTGTTVSASTYGTVKNYNYFHFDEAASDSNVKVKGDGTTVVNVKYARNSYTFDFALNGGRDYSNATMTIGGTTYTNNGEHYSFTAKFGEDVSSKWPTASNMDTVTTGSGRNKTSIDYSKYFEGWSGGSGTSLFSSMRWNVTPEMIKTSDNATTQYYKGTWNSNLYQVELHYWVQNTDDDNYTELTAYAQKANTSRVFNAKDIAGFKHIANGDNNEWVKDSEGNWIYSYNFYYTRNVYKISFYNGSNTAEKTVENIRFGKSISDQSYEPTRPSSLADYYSFGGWYTTSNCVDGSEFSFVNATMPSSNLALYAKWTPDTCTVTFDSDEGTAVDSQTISKGTTATKPEDPTKDGFDFAGWTINGAAFNFSTVLEADTTLVANWLSKAKYTVTYDANAQNVTGNVPSDTTLYANGAKATVKTGSALSLANKVFVCWNTAADGSGTNYYPGAAMVMPAGNVTLYAKWADVTGTTTLTYHSNNTYNNEYVKTTVNNEKVKVESFDSLFGDSDPNSYFTGWKTSDGRDIAVGSFVLVDIGNTQGTNDLYAQWCAKTTVTITGDSANYNYTGAQQSVSTFAKTGLSSDYNLSGVTYSANGTDAGEYEGKFGGKAVITKNGQDVTYQFKIVYENGKLTITKRNITLTSATASKPYDGTALTNHDVVVSGDGFVTGEGATYDVTGTQTVVGHSSNAFTYTLNNGTKADNYIITKTEGTLTITKAPATSNAVTATPYNGTYDANAHTITASAAQTGSTLYYSKVGGADATDWSTTAPTWTNVTAAQTVYVKATNPNYEDSFGQAAVTITAKPVTVTANDKSKVYGTADPALDATVSGTIGTDTVAYTLSRAAGENVGTYAITPAGEAAQGNYSVTYAPGTLTITKAPAEQNAVTATPYSGTYDAAAHTITASAAQTGSTLYYSKVGGKDATDWNETAPTWTNVTAAQTVYVKATNPNYEDSFGQETVTITAKAVTVTANNKSKVYGTADPTLDAAVEGTLGNDTVAYTFSRAAGEDVGTYAITPAGEATQGNYSVTFVPATLTITAKQVIVTANDKTKVYGADDPAFDATVAGTLGKDTVDYTFSRAAGENVGTYAITPAGEATQGNYTVKYVEGTLTITAPSITDENRFTVSQPADVVYNGKSQEQTVTVKDTTTGKDLELGTDYTLTYSADTTNVGTVKVTVTGIGNYAGTVERTYKITPYPLTITAASASKIVDGTALTNNGYTADAPVDGEKIISVKITGSQTSIGSSANVASDAVIKRGDIDTTKNYKITYVDGTLTVNPVPFVAAPSMSSAKTITNRHADGTGFAAGETVNFSITVTNTGNVVLSNVKVVDTMTKLDTTIESIAIGETETVTTSYTVTQADIDNRVTLTNTATVTPSDPGVTPQNPQIIIPIATPTASIASVKTITSTPANGVAYAAGETVTFAITVTNTGNTTQNNVTVTDALTGLNTTIATIPVGQSATVTTSYTVTAADVAAGTLSNTAVVTPGPDPTNPNPTPQNPTVIIPIAPPIVPATPVVPPVVPTAPTTTTTTTTTTTDTTTTVAPAPAATAPTASVGTTTVTVPDTKVPLADGGLKYTLTAIGDNTVPLASGTNEHKCCILHFLLLLAALVVEIFYIRSAKKHQKRIHELRRQIADEKQKLELINDRNAENQQVG